jgi:hypothetical protein
LAERIAEIDRRAVFGGLGIHRHAAMAQVGRGGDVPFLRVTRRRVSVKKRITDPGFKDQAVALHLLRAQCRCDRQRAGKNNPD